LGLNPGLAKRLRRSMDRMISTIWYPFRRFPVSIRVSAYPAPPIPLQSAPAAIALFRLHVERQGQIAVDDTNREQYRELTFAGLMRAGSTFRDGEESIYRLTQEGFERKAELLSRSEESP
jgi:hypothetical protein